MALSWEALIWWMPRSIFTSVSRVISVPPGKLRLTNAPQQPQPANVGADQYGVLFDFLFQSTHLAPLF